LLASIGREISTPAWQHKARLADFQYNDEKPSPGQSASRRLSLSKRIYLNDEILHVALTVGTVAIYWWTDERTKTKGRTGCPNRFAAQNPFVEQKNRHSFRERSLTELTLNRRVEMTNGF